MNKPSYLIAASSGRALAASAHRAGLPVHVVDLFADRDTRGYAHTARIVGTLRDGFDPARLFERIGQLRRSKNIEGLVVGSGFEDQPEFLELLSQSYQLFGNPASTVRLVKDPADFFGLLERLGIPYPETVQQPVDNSTGWLIKRIGATGGDHIRWLKPREIGKPGYYLQRPVEGRSYSVVFLANGKGVRIIGYNELWHASGFEQTPFKYGGAVSLPGMEGGLAGRLTEAIQELVAALELRGLCGLDLIVDTDHRFYVLEINPRPPATFELHEENASLFQQHLSACCGRLPQGVQGMQNPDVRAHAILYAARPIEIVVGIGWPVWTRDLPMIGTSIEQGAPVCTVNARARDPEHARRLVIERLKWLESKLLWRAAA